MKTLPRALLLLSVLLLASSLPQPAHARGEELPIAPVVQRTPVWCWVAVGEMVFRHYGVPNINPVGEYQCGIIGALAGPQHRCWYDCRQCVVPAGAPQNVSAMLLQYPMIAGSVTRQRIAGVRSRYRLSSISEEEVRGEIDAGRPVIAGISPSGITGPFAQHVSLVVGYDDDDEDFRLIVNDPYPYQYVGNRFDPYIRAGGRGGNGRYLIGYDEFRANLRWTETFYQLEQ